MTPYFGNGSSDRKKALKKSTRFENNPKSVCTKSHEGFDDNSVSTSRKKLLIPLAGIMFFLKNWPTFNFKIGVHQQKKALNKNKKFVINKKTFPLARMKDSLKKTISVDEKTASIWISVWSLYSQDWRWSLYSQDWRFYHWK